MKSEIRDLLLAKVTIPEDKRCRFFKTGKGDYSEHDQFLGVRVPDLRKIAKIFIELPLNELKQLLSSPYNEERLLALLIMVDKYHKKSLKKEIFEFYLENLKYVNNWNLVDISAHLIIGSYLQDKPKDFLITLASSNILWERRIAIVATWWFIKQGDLKYTIKIAELLLNDKEDLIHKATGWMLRELGKKDSKLLQSFLTNHKKTIPRTMLRYAIEKFSTEKRKEFLGS